VLGCIDGTFIPIAVPLGDDDDRDYVHRHNGHSLNVQVNMNMNILCTAPLNFEILYCSWLMNAMLMQGDFCYQMSLQVSCDFNNMITSLDAKGPGSVHDSRIFRESTLYQRLQQGMAAVHCII